MYIAIAVEYINESIPQAIQTRSCRTLLLRSLARRLLGRSRWGARLHLVGALIDASSRLSHS